MSRVGNMLSWRHKRSRHTALDRHVVGLLGSKRFPSLRQLRYAGKVLASGEYRVVKILFAVLLVNLIFLGWRAFTADTGFEPKSGGTYTEGVVGVPQYINPIFVQNDVDRDLSSLVYSGLLRYTSNREMISDLAESYEISDDAKSYTFHLRRDVKWHDGQPVSIDDVVFTVNLIKDPKSRSPLSLSYKEIEVKKVDDATVLFVLPKPFAPFLDLIATTGIMPRHVWGSLQPENIFFASPNVKPVGTGPWKYDSFSKDKDGTLRSYTFKRFDEYFGAKPFLDTIVFKFYPDNDSSIQALKSRHVDGVSFLPRRLRSKLQKDNQLAYYTFQIPQYTAIFFNQKANPDLSSKAVRQALAFAIDKERIVRDVLSGEGTVIHSPLLPGFLGYSEKIKTYQKDAAKASALLETAGWKKDEQGNLYKMETEEKEKEDGTKEKAEIKRYLTITLTTVQRPEHADIAAIVKENWEHIGVKTDLAFADPALVKSDVIDSRDYEALLYGAIIGADPDLYPFWHSSQIQPPGLNLSQFSNETVDTLLEEGRHLTDPEQRAERYAKFQDIMSDEVPAIFLYSPTYNYVVDTRIKGVRDGTYLVYPADRLLDLTERYIKTKRTRK